NPLKAARIRAENKHVRKKLNETDKGEDEDRSKVTSGTAPVPLTPQRISPPAAYFPRFAQMRAAGVRYGQPNNVNPQPH
ncbi:hypothetical protein, partial [Enterocloster bolteae]|uniref:hypothetical protein n=1 Tax=Enterocloster bolteae TaxID=208479 RepID=UPI002A7FC40E